MGAVPDPLPVQIPLFPLPGVVPFPGATVPLHIFEPRYRAMVRRCLDGDRIFGMVLSHAVDPIDDDPDAWVAAPDGARFQAIGTAGAIVAHQSLPDGRSYILVQGLQRFRVSDVDASEPYLTARVAYLRGDGLPAERDHALHCALQESFADYLRHCQGDTERALVRVREASGASDAADLIASCIDVPVARRQALLEVLDPAARCAAVLQELRGAAELPAMTALARRSGWPPPSFSVN